VFDLLTLGQVFELVKKKRLVYLLVSMSIFTLCTIWLSRLRVSFLYYLVKITGKGGGTSLPGKWIEETSPELLAFFNGKYKKVILISGTNGKTTVRALLVSMLEREGYRVNTNRGGANILRGIATALFLDLTVFLKIKSDVLVLEVEEATLPRLTKYIQGYTLVLTNIFRDQLDAYGEIDQTLEFFVQSLHGAEHVVINSGDTKLCSVLKNFQGPINAFTLPNQTYEYDTEELDIEFNTVWQATIVAQTLEGTTAHFTDGAYSLDVHLKLPGDYNVLNALTAWSVGFEMGVRSVDGLESAQPVFGRGEMIHIGKHTCYIYLIKNPAGFDRVLDFLKPLNIPKNIYMLINDNIADGKDVSWLWDVQLESFVSTADCRFKTAGTRGLDMLLRLEYADADVDENDYITSIAQTAQDIISSNQSSIVLATYTAMRQFRQALESHVDISAETARGN
jgi:lipid II isoglutaminyl synthase (glutamine-hydrolysing)